MATFVQNDHRNCIYTELDGGLIHWWVCPSHSWVLNSNARNAVSIRNRMLKLSLL